MFVLSKFRYVALPCKLSNSFWLRTEIHQIEKEFSRGTSYPELGQVVSVSGVTISAGTEEGGSESDPLKARMFTDPHERRGYKYDETLDLTALIDKGSAMGYINTGDADGFRARNFRTGAEPPDPEKAKEIMVFFKNRSKPKKLKAEYSEGSLYASGDTSSGRPKDAGCPNRGRMPPRAQHPTRKNEVMRKMHAQPNNTSATRSNHQPPRGSYNLSKPQKK